MNIRCKTQGTVPKRAVCSEYYLLETVYNMTYEKILLLAGGAFLAINKLRDIVE